MVEKAIGFIETDSVAAGIEAADAAVKTASVELLEARSICPGKFMVLFRGDTSQVNNALRSGVKIAGASVVDTLFLPNAHPAIFMALDLSSETTNGAALGIIETVTAASCIVASDAAAKAAEVNLLELRLANGLGGKSFLLMEGEVADVEGCRCSRDRAARRRWSACPEDCHYAACRSSKGKDRMTSEEIVQRVQAAGIVGAGGAGFPTHVKLAAKNVDTVIANGAECEPMLRCDQQLMAAHPELVIRGMRLVMQAVGAGRGLIAVKAHYANAVAALQAELDTQKGSDDARAPQAG